MIYKCPLCLEEITSGMQIVRYCAIHPNRIQSVVVSDEIIAAPDFAETFFCPHPQCKGNDVVGTVDAVFLSHVGCEAKNPFWDDQKQVVTIPGLANDGNVVKVNIANQQVEINHWQIGMLREIKYNPSHSYMWFPLMLFWAIARTEERRGFGSMVALLGHTEVGKTILAMQATDRQGYIQSKANGRKLDLADFVFSRLPEPGALNPLFETIYLRQLLYDDDEPPFRPEPSLRVPGDLKAVFMRPSKKVRMNTGAHPLSPVAMNDSLVSGRLAAKTYGFAKSIGLVAIWNLIRYSVINFFTFGMADQQKPQENRSFWYTALFYDTAGEGSLKNDGIVRRVLRNADKIAILVNAEDIFLPSGGEDTIRVAHARLDDLKRQNSEVSRCLVITQIDKVINQIGEDANIIRTIAESLDESDGEMAKREIGVVRQLISKYLRAGNTPKRMELVDDLEAVDNIFFLWTENLPPDTLNPWIKSKAAQQGARQKPPESFGLAKFVCWCLDIQWSDINQV